MLLVCSSSVCGNKFSRDQMCLKNKSVGAKCVWGIRVWLWGTKCGCTNKVFKPIRQQVNGPGIESDNSKNF